MFRPHAGNRVTTNPAGSAGGNRGPEMFRAPPSRTSENRKLASAACKKIGCQFDTLDSPEARLMAEVFIQAVRDGFATDNKADAAEAQRYLDGPMPHVQLLGVDPEWVRSVLLRIGLDPSDPPE